MHLQGVCEDLLRISVELVCVCKVFVSMLYVRPWILCGFEKILCAYVQSIRRGFEGLGPKSKQQTWIKPFNIT